MPKTTTCTVAPPQTELSIKWRAILYDNDFIAFDEVVKRIIEGTGYSLADATDYANKAEIFGKTPFFWGTYTECLKATRPLNAIGVQTDILPSELGSE